MTGWPAGFRATCARGGAQEIGAGLASDHQEILVLLPPAMAVVLRAACAQDFSLRYGRVRSRATFIGDHLAVVRK